MPQFNCPHCGKPLQMSEKHLGARVRCAVCREEFQLPTESAPVAGAAQPRRFAWESLGPGEVRDPWDKHGEPRDPGWPEPDDLDDEPLPDQLPSKIEDLGKPRAS